MTRIESRGAAIESSIASVHFGDQPPLGLGRPPLDHGDLDDGHLDYSVTRIDTDPRFGIPSRTRSPTLSECAAVASREDDPASLEPPERRGVYEYRPRQRLGTSAANEYGLP